VSAGQRLTRLGTNAIYALMGCHGWATTLKTTRAIRYAKRRCSVARQRRLMASKTGQCRRLWPAACMLYGARRARIGRSSQGISRLQPAVRTVDEQSS
jgi:hypothetical protein